MKLTDDGLLREWYWMHVMANERSPEDPRGISRNEEFKDMLDHCAKMMATEAILYSEEEVQILANTLEAEEKADDGRKQVIHLRPLVVYSILSKFSADSSPDW